VLESLAGTHPAGTEFLLSRFNSMFDAGIFFRLHASAGVSNPAACGCNTVRK
jgi:hypothetical protein